MSMLLLPLLVLLPAAAARNSVDTARLGNSKYSTMPLSRASGGTNSVSVRVGTPPQTVNLTASATEWYLSVASTQCDGCAGSTGDKLFNATASSSYVPSKNHLVYHFNYPSSPADSLTLNGVFARDAVNVGDEQGTPPVFPMVDMNGLLNGESGTALAQGTTGFWGLGVDPREPSRSILPYMVNSQGKNSFTFGIDVKTWSLNPGTDAGTMHWGGVPDSAYLGSFNWLNANASTGWSTPVDTIKINGMTLDMAGYYATFDPGFDEMYLPRTIAERVFTNINAQQRQGDDVRWYLGCNSNITMSITLSGTEYALDPATLLTSRWSYGVCSSNIVSWQSDSVPGGRNEIRLGAAFLSGVYAAFYYSKNQHYIGLAGKPNAINGGFVSASSGTNKVVIGAVVGTLIPLLFILLAVCYFRNRQSVQATWNKRYRRAERDNFNRSMPASSAAASVTGDGAHLNPYEPDPLLTPYISDSKPPIVPVKEYRNVPRGEKEQMTTYANLSNSKRSQPAEYLHPDAANEWRGPGPTPATIPIPVPDEPSESPAVFNSWRRNPFGRLLGNQDRRADVLPTRSNVGVEGLGLYDPAPQQQLLLQPLHSGYVPNTNLHPDAAQEYANPYIQPMPSWAPSLRAPRPQHAYTSDWAGAYQPVPEAETGGGFGRAYQRDYANGYGGQSPDPILAALYESQRAAAAAREQAEAEALAHAQQAEYELHMAQVEYQPAPPEPKPDPKSKPEPKSISKSGAKALEEAAAAYTRSKGEYKRFKQQELDREREYQRHKTLRNEAAMARERDYYQDRERRREKEKEDYLKTRDKWRERERKDMEREAEPEKRDKAERGERREMDQHKDKDKADKHERDKVKERTQEVIRAKVYEVKGDKERGRERDKSDKRDRSRSRDRCKERCKEHCVEHSKHRSSSKDRSMEPTWKEAPKDSLKVPSRGLPRDPTRDREREQERYDPRAAFDPKWKRAPNMWSTAATVNPPNF